MTVINTNTQTHTHTHIAVFDMASYKYTIKSRNSRLANRRTYKTKHVEICGSSICLISSFGNMKQIKLNRFQLRIFSDFIFFLKYRFLAENRNLLELFQFF